MTARQSGPIIACMATRSISYSPESIDGTRARSAPVSNPVWILCRKLEQFPIPDDLALQRLAKLGRIRRDDFLVNTRLGTCERARDVAQLGVIFTTMRLEHLAKVSPLLSRAVAALCDATSDVHQKNPRGCSSATAESARPFRQS